MLHAGLTNTLSQNGNTVYAMKQGVYEYQLVLYPNGEIGKAVNDIRRSLLQSCNLPVSTSNTPIEICRFVASEDMEQTIARWLQRICGQQQSFHIVLNNFGGTPGQAIFLRVQNPQVLEAVNKQLHAVNDYITSYQYPPIRQALYPKLLLAQGLRYDVYEKAMIAYAQKEYHESFLVNELVLLKKRQPNDAGEKINVFGLQPQLTSSMYTTYPLIF